MNKNEKIILISFASSLINDDLSESFLEQNIEKLDLDFYFNPKTQQCSLNAFKDSVKMKGWDIIAMCQSLSETFIDNHIDKLDSYLVAKYQTLSELFIKRHINEYFNVYNDKCIYDWTGDKYLCSCFDDDTIIDALSRYQSLSISFIKQNIKDLCCSAILANLPKDIPEDLLKEIVINANDVTDLLVNHDISESFVKDMSYLFDTADWYNLFSLRNVSEQFIESCVETFENAAKKRVPDFLGEHHIWNAIFINQTVSIDFVEKHMNKADWDEIAHEMGDEFIKYSNYFEELESYMTNIEQ